MGIGNKEVDSKGVGSQEPMTGQDVVSRQRLLFLANEMDSGEVTTFFILFYYLFFTVILSAYVVKAPQEIFVFSVSSTLILSVVGLIMCMANITERGVFESLLFSMRKIITPGDEPGNAPGNAPGNSPGDAPGDAPESTLVDGTKARDEHVDVEDFIEKNIKDEYNDCINMAISNVYWLRVIGRSHIGLAALMSATLISVLILIVYMVLETVQLTMDFKPHELTALMFSKSAYYQPILATLIPLFIISKVAGVPSYVKTKCIQEIDIIAAYLANKEK